MPKEISIEKTKDLQKIFEEAYRAFSMKYKKELAENYAVDSPYDYAKWAFSHIDIVCNTDLNASI